MANATMELTSYIYTINIQLVTRFICMHREGRNRGGREPDRENPPPPPPPLSSREKNRKENHRFIEMKFFNFVQPLSPPPHCASRSKQRWFDQRNFAEIPLYSFHQVAELIINILTDWNDWNEDLSHPFLAREIKLDVTTRKDHICNR